MSYKKTGQCYEAHQPYTIGGLTFHGGSCITPTVKDADIYIGFDRNMTIRPYKPWQGEKPNEDAYFFIQDMSIPNDAEDFRKLAEWAIEQAKAGKKVHAGCIGGHGRTGMFLALVTQLIAPELNAIDHVRTVYCHKAVETTQQEKFLMENYGCAKPSSVGVKSGYSYGGDLFYSHKPAQKPKDPAEALNLVPMAASYCIFDK